MLSPPHDGRVLRVRIVAYAKQESASCVLYQARTCSSQLGVSRTSALCGSDGLFRSSALYTPFTERTCVRHIRMPSLFRLIDEYLFLDSPDRITLCDDNRAHVRLPARGLRSIAQTIWLIITCSWTNILLPFTLAALLLDPGTSEVSHIFWLNYLALLPVVGLFRYASEVLSVAAPSLVRMVWSFTLGPFSLDTEVSQYLNCIKILVNISISDCFHRAVSRQVSAGWNIHRWQDSSDSFPGKCR